MDVSGLSLVELKAMAWDEECTIKRAHQNLQILQQAMVLRVNQEKSGAPQEEAAE